MVPFSLGYGIKINLVLMLELIVANFICSFLDLVLLFELICLFVTPLPV